MKWVDTHCHLNDPDAFPDPIATIDAAVEAGVEAFAVVGYDGPTIDGALRLANQSDRVYVVAGWHPNSAASWGAAARDAVLCALKHPRAIAYGEIGLDYHWDFATKDQQLACLTEQLDMASELDLPVVLHCREAYDDLLTILERRPPGQYDFHCFSGDETDAERALNLGGMLGVDGPVTYPKNTALCEIIAEAPRERILLETDAPWMAPSPYRGKPNQPAYLPLIGSKLGVIWNCSDKEVARQTTENASTFFGRQF